MTLSSIFLLNSCKTKINKSEVGLTLIPPASISNQVDLDIRGGIKNMSEKDRIYKVSIYWNEETENAKLYSTAVNIKAGQSNCVKYTFPTKDKIGCNDVILVVEDESNTYRIQKPIEIIVYFDNFVFISAKI